MMKKRVFGILLSFALMLTMMPVLSTTAYAEPTQYPLWVGGVQVTSANADDVLGDADEGATVKFTPATTVGETTTPATLTLDGANISGEHTDGKYKSAAIYYEDENNELIINATSASTVTGPSNSNDCYTIYSKGNLTINGNGSLTTNGGTSSDRSCFGVHSDKKLTVNGTLNVNKDNTNVNFGVIAWGIVVNKNGKLTAKGIDCIVNYDGGIVVEGKLDATSTSIKPNDGTAISISGSDGITVKEGGELIANGVACGISSADGLSININKGAKLSAIGGEGVTSDVIIYNAIRRGTVKNAIKGTYWENVEGTGEGKEIKEDTKQGHTFGEKAKRIQFPPRPADAVKYMIGELPADPTTEDDRAAVKAAREAYDVLSDDEKDEIKYTLLKKLETAEETIRQADLAEAKSSAKTELANYKSKIDESVYDADGIAALDAAKTAGDKAIDKARDAEGVQEALAYAKAALDAVSAMAAKTSTAVGSVHDATSSVGKYVVTSANTVSLVKAQNKKSFTLPTTVRIGEKSFKVTGISPKAFKGTKVKTLTVKTKGLTKASVKDSLKGSKVKTIKVKVGNKKTNKKYVKKYKKVFKKKNWARK